LNAGRRADDFVSGRTSHTLVQQELQATAKMLDEAALTEDQTRRLLTATGKLAQLAAWVAADAGLYRQAARYTEGGVLAGASFGQVSIFPDFGLNQLVPGESRRFRVFLHYC
jgi:hypothetical protein